MTTYASFDYYEGHPSYLTPGKRYEVLSEGSEDFRINCDTGMEIYCRWLRSVHIHERNWTRHVEPKQTRYRIQVPGYAFIEHAIDYRIDGDMLYVAGADFEHYYLMKPGDLVTITEKEEL